MLDILRLRVLAAIAAQGSVTKAGEGIRLTPEGEHLARRATEIVRRVETDAAEPPT